MNFDLDDEQRDFARGAKDFYESAASPAGVRDQLGGDSSVAPGLKSLADIGFYGITVAESAGGSGRTVLDLAVVAEQGGRVLAGPSLATAARAAVLLAGDDTRSGSLADGSVAYAVVDGPHPSLDALGAQTYLALVDGQVVAAPGETTTGREQIDPSRGLASVTLGSGDVVVSGGRWETALQVGRVVLAAEDLGTAAKAVEVAVDYAKMRTAFGRQIGSYQAVKHALVNAYVGVEQLRSLVWWAAWTADQSPHELPMASAAVKAYAGQVLEQATSTAIQVHGGIGFTWEHDAHLYWRRAKVDRLLLGDQVSLLDEVAELALA
ncbi:MAG TPA: acyl-CoA dehydrogenase family protein [Mycobacteriales bacterium]